MSCMRSENSPLLGICPSRERQPGIVYKTRRFELVSSPQNLRKHLFKIQFLIFLHSPKCPYTKWPANQAL